MIIKINILGHVQYFMFFLLLFVSETFTLNSFSLNSINGEISPRCYEPSVFKVTDADHGMNGIYVCDEEKCINSNKSDSLLSKKYVLGKHGPRLVWTLASSRGTIYFAVPPNKTSPGAPHIGSWKTSAGIKSDHMPLVVQLNLTAQVGDQLSTLLLMGYDAWRFSLAKFRYVPVEERTPDVLIEYALVNVRYAWNLTEAERLLTQAQRIDSSNVSIEVSALLALVMCVNGNIQAASSMLYQSLALNLTQVERGELMDKILNDAYVQLSDCDKCISLPMKSIFELAARTLLDLGRNRAKEGHMLVSPHTKQHSIHQVLRMLSTSTRCSVSSLSSTHLRFASSLMSFGDCDTATAHIAEVIQHHCYTDISLRKRNKFEVDLLEQSLLIAVPSVITSAQHGQDIYKLLSEVFTNIKDPLNGWGGSADTGLGVRWHFLLAYLGSTNGVTVHRDIIEGVKFMQPQLQSQLVEMVAHESGKRKVGFLSSFWRFHSVGRLLGPLALYLADHGFDVVVIHCGSGSLATEETDPILKSFKQFTPKNNHGGTLTQVQLSKQLHTIQSELLELKLDILVWGDIGMDAMTSSLAMGRYAPVQVAFWGHPVSSVSHTIDYFVSSSLFELNSEAMRAVHSEQIVMLDGLNTMFDKPPEHDDHLSQQFRKQILTTAHLDVGNIYMCAQTQSKLHPNFDRVIKGILEKDLSAVIVLSRNPLVPIATQTLAHRLDKELENLNFSQRVVFMDQTPNTFSFLALQCAADVVLDPIVFGGGVTILEALSCPVPVVTAPSLQAVLNLAAGMLIESSSMHLDAALHALLNKEHSLSLPLGSIAHNIEQYINEAVRLAQSELPQHAFDELWESEKVGLDWARFLQRAA